MSTQSYFEQRIYGELGLAPEQNTVPLLWPAIHEMTSWHDTQLFEEDEHGNIKIIVYDIDKRVITYKPNPNEKEYYNRYKAFYIVRFKEPETYKDKDGQEHTRKYVLPKGAGTYPYFPVSLCDKYASGEKIHTLVLTEGYLKAAKGALCGLDVVGLSSITHVKDKETQTMYGDILKLIRKCAVENIIVLFDGDCRQISVKDLEAKRDLLRRPKIFFNMACKCRELLADLKRNMFFATIRSSELENQPKGLDDLLVAEKGNAQAVVDDLLAVSRPNTYFEKFDITYDTRKLYQWFKLSKAEQFYEFHKSIIREQQFVFAGTEYLYHPEKEELLIVAPAAAKNFIRVGDGYWEFVHVPNKYEHLEKQLHPRNKETIKDDYGKEIFEHVAKYKAFCNVPSHTHYQPVIHNCFNRYYEFEHDPEDGDCEATLRFIRHIFGEQYELGLDYIQLLYQRPQQIQPILCLVSVENNTGKSTFIKWLKAIFTNNCTIIGNAELSNDFNAGWATKLLIACEESFIDKKPVVERIKALSTGDKIVINQKGKDHVEVDFFGKFVLASNNEDSFIIASKADIRYWVRKVPVPTSDNVKLLDVLVPEIPYFLHFLNRREMYSRQQSRMWFSPKEIHTAALNKLIEQNLPAVVKEIREKVWQYFIDFPETELYAPPQLISKCMLSGRYDACYILRECRTHLGADVLKNDKGESVSKRCTYKWKAYNSVTDDWTTFTEKYNGRPLVFKRENFLTKSEIESLYPENEAVPHQQEIEFSDKNETPF